MPGFNGWRAMNDKARFLLKAIIIATGLFVVWSPWSHLYSLARSYSLSVFYLVFVGKIPSAGTMVEMPVNQTLAMLPFIALMAATPGMSAARKIGLILAGLVIFLGVDLALIPLVPYSELLASAGQIMFLFLPFLLWVVFSYPQAASLWMRD